MAQMAGTGAGDRDARLDVAAIDGLVHAELAARNRLHVPVHREPALARRARGPVPVRLRVYGVSRGLVAVLAGLLSAHRGADTGRPAAPAPGSGRWSARGCRTWGVDRVGRAAARRGRA